MKSKECSVDIRVYFSDTDAVGIVYHANYLDFAERARSELTRNCDINLASLAKENKFFVLRAANIQYYAPAKLDDILNVKAFISRIGSTSVEFMHEIINVETRVKVADVTCTLVFVRLVDAIPTPIKIPSEISCLFQEV